MKKGFSLIEAVIALFIMAVICYLASDSFLTLSPKYRLERAVWEIHSALSHAKYKAIFEGVSVRTRFYSSSYRIEKYDDTQKTWKLSETRFLEGVKVEANNSPVFYPEGTVSSLASILVSNSWGKYKISIAITGRVKAIKI